MPEGPDGKTIIIVKKVSGHGGHHGGAWKVAYADFVTAMMALFMVLWLVNSASEPTRQRIASYFRKPGVFQQGSGTPLELGGGGILTDTFAPPADANSQVITDKKIYEVEAHTGKVKDYFDPGGEDKKDRPGKEAEEEKKREERKKEEEENFERLKSELEEVLAEGEKAQLGLLGQVDIKVDQRGLLVEIMDTESTSMFHVGSAEILSEAETQLLKIASILQGLPNPIDIEGHTDARPFRGKRAETYDNWNLSSDRAHAARRALEAAGVDRWKIARVVGYADQRPKVAEDPLDPSNRRITIAMRFTDQAKAALEGTKTVETRPRKIRKGSKAGAASKPVISSLEEKGEAAQPKKEDEEQSSESEQEVSKKAEPPPKRHTGLRIEVGTTMPEGAIIRQADEPPPRPTRIEKDKIFGENNPFFRK